MWNAGSGLRKNFITFFCLPLLINISLRPLNCLSCFRAFHYIAFFLGRKLPELRLSYSYLKYHVWLKKFSMARNTIPRKFHCALNFTYFLFKFAEQSVLRNGNLRLEFFCDDTRIGNRFFGSTVNLSCTRLPEINIMLSRGTISRMVSACTFVIKHTCCRVLVEWGCAKKVPKCMPQVRPSLLAIERPCFYCLWNKHHFWCVRECKCKLQEIAYLCNLHSLPTLLRHFVSISFKRWPIRWCVNWWRFTGFLE